MAPYTGVLHLDDQAEASWLAYADDGREAAEILMMADPSPSGSYDPSEVVALWRYFDQKPGVGDGSTITVYGFVATPPSGNQPLLHVVRA